MGVAEDESLAHAVRTADVAAELTREKKLEGTLQDTNETQIKTDGGAHISVIFPTAKRKKKHTRSRDGKLKKDSRLRRTNLPRNNSGGLKLAVLRTLQSFCTFQQLLKKRVPAKDLSGIPLRIVRNGDNKAPSRECVAQTAVLSWAHERALHEQDYRAMGADGAAVRVAGEVEVQGDADASRSGEGDGHGEMREGCLVAAGCVNGCGLGERKENEKEQGGEDGHCAAAMGEVVVG